MPNLPEMLVAHFAVPLAGGVLVAINTRLTAEEVSYILRHSGAKVLVTDAALLPVATAAAEAIGTVTRWSWRQIPKPDPLPPLAAQPGPVSYPEFLASQTAYPLPWSVPDELAPDRDQLHLRHHRAPEGRDLHPPRRLPELVGADHPLPARRDRCYLWTLPMFHCNGWCTPWAVTAIGGTHVCLREVRGDAIWEQLRQHGVTHLNAAPTVVSTILNAARPGR